MGCDGSATTSRRHVRRLVRQRRGAERTARRQLACASGYQIDSPRTPLAPTRSEPTPALCSPHAEHRATTAVPVAGARYDPVEMDDQIPNPAGATYRQHGSSVLGRAAFQFPRSAELSSHPCSTPAGHPARLQHAGNDKSMEEALVPAFRMIVNYEVNGLLGPRTALWKAKHEARASEIEAPLGSGFRETSTRRRPER